MAGHTKAHFRGPGALGRFAQLRGHRALPPLRGAESAGERTYALYRGPGLKPEVLTIDRLGRITKGAYSGVRIVELLKTAADRGWLAYRRRADGWYSAEWCQQPGINPATTARY
jgi:hypothetical protein